MVKSSYSFPILSTTSVLLTQYIHYIFNILLRVTFQKSQGEARFVHLTPILRRHLTVFHFTKYISGYFYCNFNLFIRIPFLIQLTSPIYQLSQSFYILIYQMNYCIVDSQPAALGPHKRFRIGLIFQDIFTISLPSFSSERSNF